MSTPNFRMSLFRLHSFLGLHLCAILALLFLTGTLLIFNLEIQASFTSDMRLQEPATTHAVTPGQVYDSVKAFEPEFRVASIVKSESSWIADRVRGRIPGKRAVHIWTHPDTGAVLSMTGYRDFGSFIRDLHTAFMTNSKIGSLLVSGFSFILLFFLISGLITYRRFWKGFFRAPPRHLGPRAWWGGVHRLVALWLLPFLTIVTLTSIFYFGDFSGALNSNLYPVKPITPRETTLPEGFDGADLDRAIAAAKEVVPDLHPVRVDLPYNNRIGITIFAPSDGPINLEHGNIMQIDPVTFEILGNFPREQLPTGNWANQINHNLHTGYWGGFTSQVLWGGFGLLAAFFSLSGAMVYASRVAGGPEAGDRNAVGRIWQGMSLLRWGLVLFVLAVVALSILRYAL